MALAERSLATHFNRADATVVDHHTYFFFGDGCLMEGISHEACSFAGTQKLGKLIGFYDDNGISIDGEVEAGSPTTRRSASRLMAGTSCRNVDGHDPRGGRGAIEAAKARKDRPSLICCKTIIGYGAPNKQGTDGAHGAALGAAEVAARAQGARLGRSRRS